MDKTIIETDTTVRENTHFSEITQRDENSEDVRNAPRGHLIQFQDYTMVEQMPTTGGEADVYIISKNKKKFILKLYRYEMKPSREMVERLVQISNQFPEDIIRIYKIAKDEKLNRWYELQEFAKLGTLKKMITNNRSFALNNIHKIIEEITLILRTIHNQNIIHRDIKPDNILVRTKKPLDLIITDFGISSVLDEEMSKKMTSKSGTKIYFAPESFSGVIGKEVDYWALGMIILEILEDGNVLSGIHEGMIAHEIFTKGIKIPSTISENLQLLLKGLLTRDPKQRWNHEQIFKWLNGEKNIPTFYSFNKIETPDIKPYIFENEKFFDIKTLLTKMYTDEYYEKAKAHLLRGYVTKWLEETGQYDNAVVFELDKKVDVDLSLYKIYNHFVKANEFLFMGKLISIKNLLKFTQDNKSISACLQNGAIFEAYKEFIATNNDMKNNDLYDFLLKSTLSKNNTEMHYLGRIFLEEGSLAYQLIKNDTNNELIKNRVIGDIFKTFCDPNTFYPKTLVESINNKAYHFEYSQHEARICFEEWWFGIFDKTDDTPFLLTHNDIEKAYQFMQTINDNTLQKFKSSNLEDFINMVTSSPEDYMTLIGLKRKLAFEYTEKYLFLRKNNNDKNFIEDIKKYFPENKIVLKRLSEFRELNVIFTKEELFALEELILKIQSEISKIKKRKLKEIIWRILTIIAIIAIFTIPTRPARPALFNLLFLFLAARFVIYISRK